MSEKYVLFLIFENDNNIHSFGLLPSHMKNSFILAHYERCPKINAQFERGALQSVFKIFSKNPKSDQHRIFLFFKVLRYFKSKVINFLQHI